MDLDSAAIDKALSWLRKTTLTEFAGDLLLRFRDDGYADLTISRYLRNIAHFGEWFDTKQLTHVEFSEKHVLDFLDNHLQQCQCRLRIDRNRKNVKAALGHLAWALSEKGIISEPLAKEKFPLKVMLELDQFDHFLKNAQGLSEATRIYSQRYTGYFLTWKFEKTPIVPESLCAEDFLIFLQDQPHVWCARTVGVVATVLRRYLRYLAFLGHPVENLICAIPSVALWSKARLPQYLTKDQEDSFLHGVDRTRPQGRRDYAIFLMMCRLGLRACEVSGLFLENIDWRNGTVSIQDTKTRKTNILPFSTEIGNALIAYLCDGRPDSRDRHVFLRHRAPVGKAITTGIVHGTVNRAYKTAGLPSSITGSHRLRHTAAVRMLEGRASIKQIADILGHHSIDTTAIYAKVDLENLREVALPWPGGMS